MALKIFIGLILSLSTIFYFLPTKQAKNSNQNEDIALFIFEDPIMHTLDENGLTRQVIAKQVVRYNTRDEMYFADIILFNKDTTKEFKQESIQADFIVKKDDIYNLKKDVVYLRDSFARIDTQHLIYDDLKKIAKNSVPFEAQYYAHKYNGENLYFEIEENKIQSKNTRFEIDMIKKEGKK